MQFAMGLSYIIDSASYPSNKSAHASQHIYNYTVFLYLIFAISYMVTLIDAWCEIKFNATSNFRFIVTRG